MIVKGGLPPKENFCFGNSLYGPAESGDADMVFHRDEPHSHDNKGSNELYDFDRESRVHESHIDRFSDQARHGIYILAENKRCLIDQNIPNYTTERPCNCTYRNGQLSRISALESFSHTHYGEQAYPDSIENENRMIQSHYILPKYNREDESEHRDKKVGR